MGAIVIEHNCITEYSLNQQHLQIQDSTRAEVAGPAFFTSLFKGYNLFIECDSQAAIGFCKEYIDYTSNGTQFNISATVISLFKGNGILI